MVWDISHYILLSSATLAIVINLAVYAWRRRKTAIGRAFIVLMAAIAEWSLMTVLQLTSDSFPQQVFWHKLLFPGIVIVPVAWFVFALIYTGRAKYVTRRNLLLLCVIPALTLVAVATDGIFHLMWRELIWDTKGAFPIVIAVPNNWFWVHTVYSYSLMFLSMLWLIKTFLDSSFIYRKQAGILLLGSLIPWAVNLVFVLGLQSENHVDPTPAAFAATGLIAFWGLMRFQLLDIMPVARDTLIKDIHDGIIMVDTNNHIVDLNPAAQGITGYPASGIIGKPLYEAFPGKERDVDYFLSNLPQDTELVLGDGDARRYYKIHASSLYEQKKLRGQLILLYDITEQKKTEQRVRELRREQLELSEAIFTDTLEKRNFMTYLARELRTAFGEVLTTCRDIISSSPPEPYLEQIRKMNVNIAELDKRAREFLDFLRADAGAIEINPLPLDLLPLLKQSSEDIAPLFKRKECTLRTDLSAPLPLVLADKERTRQVTEILLMAALRLIPIKGKVGLYAIKDSAYLWTEILATGVVMTEVEREQFFDPYAGETGDRNSVSWRVGLALSKRLIELSGGQMLVEIKPERGTKFSFSLPLSPDRGSPD